MSESYNIKNLKLLIKKVVEYEKYEFNYFENPEYDETYNELWNTIEWLVDHNAYNKIPINGLNEEELDLVEYIIKDVVYRCDFPIKDEKGNIEISTVTPFAIPLAIAVPIIYKDKIESLKMLSETIKMTGEYKLFRKGFNLGEEPTIFIDGRLWKNDNTGWDNYEIIRQYIKSYVMYISNITPVIFSLSYNEKKKKSRKKVNKIDNINNKIDNKEIYLLTRTITGVILSVDHDIDNKIFGYSDTEEDIKNVTENLFMSEFAISIESELNKMGIKNPHVFSLSAWPIELWEVPEVAIQFHRITELRTKAKNAANKTPYRGNRTLKILPEEMNGVLKNLKLFVYDKNPNKPIFTHTWEILYWLDTPESVAVDIVSICTEELKVDNILLN